MEKENMNMLNLLLAIKDHIQVSFMQLSTLLKLAQPIYYAGQNQNPQIELINTHVNLKRILRNISIYFLFLLLASCHKAGEGGKASISATVKHDDKIIPFAQVYIKYNVVDFPGNDMAVYEDNELADSNGNVVFDSLYKGDYYLYAIGYDTIANQNVYGGVYVEVAQKKEARQVDVLVY